MSTRKKGGHFALQATATQRLAARQIAALDWPLGAEGAATFAKPKLVAVAIAGVLKNFPSAKEAAGQVFEIAPGGDRMSLKHDVDLSLEGSVVNRGAAVFQHRRAPSF